jgi:hypothetical protein
VNTYQQIIDNLDVEKIKGLMVSLGVDRYEENEREIRFPTICHHDSAADCKLKLYYYKDTHMFYCYSNCGPLSIFKFLEHYYETHNIEYDWYSDIFYVAQSCSIIKDFEEFVNEKTSFDFSSYKEYRSIVKLPTYDPSVLDAFIKVYPQEWLNDGISKDAMDKFNIRYSISRNKIIIPHYDIDGDLVGIRGRALNEWEIENVGKYMPIQVEKKWYKHPLSMNLYGLYQNLENIKENGYVILCESEKAIMQAESFSQPNCCVAVCGSNFNIYQLKLLLKYCQPKEIIIAFDKEQTEDDNSYMDKLRAIGQKYREYADFSFIYDNQGLLDLKDSPTDHGEEIFQKLLDKRIKIRNAM